MLTGGFLFFDDTIPECLNHTKCSSLGRFTDEKNSLCLTDTECVANNIQVDGETCTKPSLCPENLYVNYF